MKGKIFVLSMLLIFLFLLFIVQVKASDSFWREDFNYASVSQMQTAGWSVSRPSGTSIDNGAVVLNGVGGDAGMGIRNIFSSPVYNWKAEDKNMWLGHGHSTQSITVYTEKHKYTWGADGYYNEFVLYRDNVKVLRFGKYVEAANTWITLALEKNGNTISMYFNGQLEKTYTEPDTTSAQVTGVDLISPWAGDAKYDYILVEDANYVGTPSTSTPSSTSAQSTFPMTPVLIGGGIAAAVVGGIVVYYFVAAGGSAGASAGAGASGSAVGAGGGSGGGSGGGGGGQPNGNSVPEGASAGSSASSEGEGGGSCSGPASGGTDFEGGGLIQIQMEQLTHNLQGIANMQQQINELTNHANQVHLEAQQLLANPNTAASGAQMQAQSEEMQAQAQQLQSQVNPLIEQMQQQIQQLPQNPDPSVGQQPIDSGQSTYGWGVPGLSKPQNLNLVLLSIIQSQQTSSTSTPQMQQLLQQFLQQPTKPSPEVKPSTGSGIEAGSNAGAEAGNSDGESTR